MVSLRTVLSNKISAKDFKLIRIFLYSESDTELTPERAVDQKSRTRTLLVS
jgi:hypothetical protein